MFDLEQYGDELQNYCKNLGPKIVLNLVDGNEPSEYVGDIFERSMHMNKRVLYSFGINNINNWHRRGRRAVALEVWEGDHTRYKALRKFVSAE